MDELEIDGQRQEKLFRNYDPNHSEIKLLNHVARTLIFLDLMYFSILYLTAPTPWLSVGIAVLGPLLNVPALKFSLKTKTPIIHLSLTLTLIPMFCVTYYSGPNAPGWLLCFTAVIAAYFMIQDPTLKKILIGLFVLTATLGSYLGGSSTLESLVIFMALFAFSLILTRIFSYAILMTTQAHEKSDASHLAVERLRTALESLEDGFVIYDENDRLLICNKRYRELYKQSTDLLTPGNTFENIIRTGAERGQYPEAIGRKDEWIAERLRSHRAANTEIVQKLSDGRWLKISERRTPDGGTVGFRVDITQLKIAQEKADAANLAKSNFLSTMSHEIRTPLNGVLGIAQLLTHSPLDTDQRVKVDTILSSGQTLLAIISDVLDMSRIEAGGVQLENTAFTLRRLVSAVATPFQNLSDDKNLELAVIDNVTSDLVIKGDPVRLRQILWNLLSNAIKFTESGSITLMVEEEDHGRRPAQGTAIHSLKFTVSDSGTGIAADRVESIFDAFTQEDSSITRKHGGTGLGLSIVKQLTELMNGTITIDSELGEGTTFSVSIPFHEATEKEKETLRLQQAPSTSQKARSLKILLAEDNEVNAMIAKAFLKKFGHTVKHVENGKLAVEAAKENWADLILMDIHMPEMNGIDATKLIRETDSGKNIPIIGLTADAFTENHAQFIEAGMNGVLTKPFTEQQLIDTLATNSLSEEYLATLEA